MRNPVSLVVFDLDGTLVDSLRDLTESLNTLLRERGLATHDEHAVGRMVGDGAATLVSRGFAAAGCDAPPDALARFLEIYESRLLHFTRPYPGVMTLLDALGQQPVRLALLTNKPRLATLTVLEGLELSKHFGDLVVGGDEALPRKPDPAGLVYLAARTETPVGSTLLVGDSHVDFRTARAGAAQVCMARYGFGFTAFPTDQLRSSDRVIDSPLELLDLL